MNVRIRLLSLALLAALAAPPAVAAEAANDPVKLVRTLELLQDTIAHGTVANDDARRKLIDSIGMRFLSADPEVWRVSENADAAILYVLNGGDPSVLTMLPLDKDKPAGEEGEAGEHDEADAHDETDGQDEWRGKLIVAVAAYATGSPDARDRWEDVDLGALPEGLVGPAALVKANLFMDRSPREAIEYADIARLESPGTLVEEAALRRSVEIAASLRDAEKFEFYAIRYAARFPGSMYGGPFRSLFSQSYLRLVSAGTQPRLDAILESLPDQSQVGAYLEIARDAIVRAELAAAESAAGRAVELAPAGSSELRSAQLYRTAARAFVGEHPPSRDELEQLRADDVDPRDRALLAAVYEVAGRIKQWPERAPGKEPPKADAETTAADEHLPDVDAVLTRAQEALSQANETLESVDS